MSSGRRSRRLMAQINVVPYIDVMMVLLVIFMVTAPMITPGQVDLPSVDKARNVSVMPAQITIHADKSLSVTDPLQSLQDRVMSDEQLAAWVAKKQSDNPDQPVVIAADKRVRYEVVMRVMSLMQRNQVKHLGLLAVPASQP